MSSQGGPVERPRGDLTLVLAPPAGALSAMSYVREDAATRGTTTRDSRDSRDTPPSPYHVPDAPRRAELLPVCVRT